MRGSACGVEAIRNPLTVVFAVARQLAAASERVRASQVDLTGSLPVPQVFDPANRSALVEFSRLDSAWVRVACERYEP